MQQQFEFIRPVGEWDLVFLPGNRELFRITGEGTFEFKGQPVSDPTILGSLILGYAAEHHRNVLARTAKLCPHCLKLFKMEDHLK